MGELNDRASIREAKAPPERHAQTSPNFGAAPDPPKAPSKFTTT